MWAEVTYYVKVFIAIFILVNPVEGIPVFLSNTRGKTKQEKMQISRKASIAVIIVLIISLYLGRYILQLFGISIASFSIAGGIIIFLIALGMVMGSNAMKSSDKSLPSDKQEDEGDISVVPLAIPLLAGPGAISSVILYGSNSTGIWDDLILTAIVLLVGIAVSVSLRIAANMENILHETGISVMTKISGLLVAAIAVELIHSGLIQLIPSLAK